MKKEAIYPSETLSFTFEAVGTSNALATSYVWGSEYIESCILDLGIK
jgi:hypothetical protein